MSSSRARSFTTDEARRIGEQIGVDWSQAPFNVPALSGWRKRRSASRASKIALAHLNEFADYYTMTS